MLTLAMTRSIIHATTAPQGEGVMSGEQATYTPKEAAEAWGVSDQTVYRMIERGDLRVEEQRVGLFRKRYRIPASEIRRIRALIDAGPQGNEMPQPIAA